MNVIKQLAAILILSAAMSCNSSQKTELKTGAWRATLSRDAHELPFLFDLSKNPDGKTYSVVVINDTERLQMDTVYFQNDSLVIPMELFDMKIVAKPSRRKLSTSTSASATTTIVLLNASFPLTALTSSLGMISKP